MILIMAGPQGSGKGTQAKLLVEKFGLFHIEAGNLLREKAKENTVLGHKIASFINKGAMVPDKITFFLVEQLLTGQNLKKGIIFDGFPRRLTQLFWLEKKLKSKNTTLNFLIYLTLTKNESIRRLLGRRICPKCNRSYNLVTMPPKKGELCDVCQVPLVSRVDETKEAIERRLLNYQRRTSPMISYLKEKGKVLEIDGSSKVEKVFTSILKKLS